MPSRIIKESITTSESLSEVSADAERLFWRLVVKADDFGLYYGNPRILASMCFPLDPPKEQKIRAWLSELVAAGMVGTYTASEDGKQYLKLMSWDKHQQQRAKKSKFPLPVSFDNTCNQIPGPGLCSPIACGGTNRRFCSMSGKPSRKASCKERAWRPCRRNCPPKWASPTRPPNG